MASLRILQVVPYFEGAWAYGGIPRLVSAMVRGLVRRGHHVTVCTTDVCDARSRLRNQAAAVVPGVDVQVFRNLSNRLAYHWQVFTPIGLFRYLRNHADRFDVAHLHACRNLPGVLAAHRCMRAGVPYVLSPNGTAPAIERRIRAKRLFDRALGERVLERAARVIAVTVAERRQLLSVGVAPGRIADIPNPLNEDEFEVPRDPDAYRRRHRLGRGSLLLFLGKITPRKGVDVLVRALASIRTTDACLAIAGNDMGAWPIVQSAISSAGVQDRVIRLDLLRGVERLEAMAAADLVVYPSRDEIFGLVPLEALLCGTPVVVCNDSGCGEIIARIGGGRIVPFGDPVMLASAIDSILADPEAWRSRTHAAAARAKLLFGSNAVCEQLEHLYREAVAGASTHDRRIA